MTPHLYVLSIGPVQGFIAAARRTRDLWMGSLILSEISKAAAKKIADSGGELIFPALAAGSKDLEPAFPPGNAQSNPANLLKAFSVANVIRAVIPENIECSLQEFDRDVKDAAKAEWMKYANSTLFIINKNDPGAINSIWDEQVKDVIEFYSAWVPLGDNNYPIAQKRLMRILTARKATRDFKPASVHWGVEKSSLDGARESVLEKRTHLSKDLTLRLRLTKSEHLCAVGLTKRLGGSKVPFPPVSRIALDPWIRGIENSKKQSAIDSLGKIKDLCQGEKSFCSGTGTRLYQKFPFDGQICYQERLKGLRGDIETLEKDFHGDKALQSDLSSLNEIEEHAAKLWEVFGEPNPYLAVMVADGDRMGKVISNIDSSQRHREFSKALADFAGKTRNIVENECHGVLVFAGGEDILAFLPMDTCLRTARKLHDMFGELLAQFPDEEGNCPTLSVGIAIGHFLDPLEDLLEYGREAEKDAKDPDRNGLAVHLHTRNGGDPIKVRDQWDSTSNESLDRRLDTWIGMYRDKKFPDGAAYDLHQLAGDYTGWKDIPAGMLSKDVERLLKRKRAEGGMKSIEEEDIKTLLNGVATPEDITRRAEELILARRIDAVARQASGPVQEETTL